MQRVFLQRVCLVLCLGTLACQIDEGGLPGHGSGGAPAMKDGGSGDAGGAAGTGGSAGTGGTPATDAGTDDQMTADAPADNDAGTDAPLGGDGPATDGADDDGPPAACQHCTGYGTPRALGVIPAVVRELSGLAVSRSHDGILYVHNDSGDSARFFAMDQTAGINTELDLPGATNTDWEDIAMGPCPTGACVYIGDIGDNDSNRDGYTIYRVAEPDTLPGGGAKMNVTFERFPFVYPDGEHNAESLLVHPQSGRVFVVTKEKESASGVYEMPLPLQADKMVTVVRVATLSVPVTAGPVTAGAFHPCGDRILIRSKPAGLFELTRPAGGDVISIFGAPPVTVPVAVEPQGEAVDYTPDGLGYYTSSEIGNSATLPNLSLVRCQ